MDISERKLVPSRSVNRHPWEIARMRIVLKTLKELQSKLSVMNGNILDFGCGDAFVSNSIALNFPMHQVICIDNQFTSLENSKLQFCDHSNMSFHGSIDDAHLAKKSICIVFLLDILEHIKDDALFLKNIVEHDIVQNGAIFIITAPAFQSLFSNHDDRLNHYRRYSIAGLSAIMKSAGLELIEKGYIFRSLIPLRLFKICLERVGYHSPVKNFEVFSWKSGDYLSDLVINLLMLDFGFFKYLEKFKILLPGLSCFLMGKK